MFWRKRSLSDTFEVAAGSTIGAMHRRAGKNNQDAYGIVRGHDYIIGVVCDGASKGIKYPDGDWTHSEVGAHLCSRWLLELLQFYCIQFLRKPHLLTQDSPFPYWEDIREELVRRIHVSASQMDGDVVERIVDYFLCTTLGVMVTPYGVCTFAIGDGVFILNGTVDIIGPFQDNQPPYPIYALTGSIVTDGNSDLLAFSVGYMPLSALENVVVATDGLEDLISQSEATIPGTQEPVGDISQLWTNDAHFTNPVSLSRYLSRVNRESVQLDREAVRIITHHGLLRDDTTCVVVRRRPDA